MWTTRLEKMAGMKSVAPPYVAERAGMKSVVAERAIPPHRAGLPLCTLL